MFSERAPVDFTFFSGLFLSVLGFATFSWISLFYGGFEISGGLPITLIENEVLFAGLILSAGSLGYMMFGTSLSERRLPSQALVIDFMFVIGLFLVAAGFSWDVCYGTCGAFSVDSSLSFMFIGLALLAESVFLWHREKKARRGSLRWEVLSSVWLGILALILFVPLEGGVTIPTQLYLVNYVIAAMCIIGLTIGIWGLREGKRKRALIQNVNQLEQRIATRRFWLGSLIIIVLAMGFFSTGIANGYLLPGCAPSCGSNVKTITLVSGACSASLSTCYFVVSNPTQATTLANAQVTNASNNSIIENLSPNFQVPAQTARYNMTIPFPNNIPFRATVNYQLDFSNGESISGQLVVQ